MANGIDPRILNDLNDDEYDRLFPDGIYYDVDENYEANHIPDDVKPGWWNRLKQFFFG